MKSLLKSSAIFFLSIPLSVATICSPGWAIEPTTVFESSSELDPIFSLSPSIAESIAQQPNSAGTDERLSPNRSTDKPQAARSQVHAGLGLNNNRITGAVGYKFNRNFGVEIGAVFSSDDLPTIEETPAPPGISTSPIGERRTTPQYGIDGLGYLPMGPLSLYGGVGIYFQELGTLVRSDTNGLVYKQSTRNTTDLAWSSGVQTKVSDNLRIGAGYHSIRGVNVHAGWTF
jgi:hypothetical protein